MKKTMNHGMNGHSVFSQCPAIIASLHCRETHAAKEFRVAAAMNKIRNAKYQIGQVVRHRLFPFRGVVFDIDPIFSNTEEWYESIPADVRPHKDQPFYHLFAENEETEYIAYVSEQNLLPDDSGEPVRHPQVAEVFVQDGNGGYRPRSAMRH
jgi:heat shock protein HspQ